ncbi:MAG TPA: trigger factor [Tepidisphaeraceae bacterium]|jgi:trigger factor
MAENEAATATAEKQDYQYNVKVEDAGPGAKKVTVEIPEERITEKLSEQFKELRQQAAIPGFRLGHAPQKLVEKRFASDVREQVRRSLISESYEQAVEKNSLQVLGEPEFEKPDALEKLPDSGPLSYTFSVEVQPEFQIPDLTNLQIKKPKAQVTDENVQQAMQNLREQQGTLVPVENRGVEARDHLVADIHVKADGNVITHQHDAQLVTRPGRVAGIQIDDLDKQLEGMKPEETRTINAHAPESHPNEALRNKDVQIEVTLKDIKKLEAAEINEDFIQDLGFQNEQEVRDALRDQMVERINYDVQQAMREQVNKYLLDNTNFELPAKMSDRQTDRIAGRRAVDLMMRGVPKDQVQAHLDELKTGAKDEAARELKLFFILQKIASEQNVDVDEAELNGRIAMLAAQRGKRPEKVKQEMAKDGSLANLYVQMREQKAVDKILEQAKIEEVEAPKPDAAKE